MLALRPLANGLVIATLAVAASACEKRAAESPPSERPGAADKAAESAEAAPADAGAVPADAAPPAYDGPVGTVRGRVVLKKGAALPIAPPIVGADGKAPISQAPCPPVDASDRRTVAARDGGLSPVHVAVTEFTAAPDRGPRVHEVFLDACRLRPTLLGAKSGDRVRITNRSEVALLPVLPGDRFMQAVLPRESREFPVSTLGTMLIGCAFANYCGESAIITLSHSLFAVTAPDGSFTIENVPVGQKLVLNAWHPLFEATSVPFELTESGGEQTFELELEPSAGAASEAPAKPAKPQKPAKAGKKAPASP